MLEQLLAPLVGVFEHGRVAGDVDFEFDAAATIPPVEAPELPLSVSELLGGSIAQLVEAFLLLCEETHRLVAVQARLVESERLGGGAPE